MSKDETTQEEAVNSSQESTDSQTEQTVGEVAEQAPQEKPKDDTPAATIEETIGDVIGKKEQKQSTPDTVPYSRLQEKSAEVKELKAKVAELQKKAERGTSTAEITDELSEYAEENGLDAKALSKLTNIIVQRTEAQLESKVDEKLAPLTKQQKEKALDEAFKKHYNNAIENAPEFKEIANSDVIKTLALDPRNSKKTFTQLLEETYGNAVAGRSSAETTKAGGSKEPQGKVDVDRAKKDPAYFSQVMADPTLKKQYNEGLTERLSRYL